MAGNKHVVTKSQATSNDGCSCFTIVFLLSSKICIFSILAGFLTTSSLLTIGTDADLKSEGLENHAETCGCWKSEDGQLNFAKAFTAEYAGISLSDKQRPENRLQYGRKLLENLSTEGIIIFLHTFCQPDQEFCFSMRKLTKVVIFLNVRDNWMRFAL